MEEKLGRAIDISKTRLVKGQVVIVVQGEKMSKLINRLVRASRLDASLFEEVGADKGATWQAVGIVFLSCIAAGIGSIGKEWHINILVGTFFPLFGWFVWTYLVYFIGAVIFPEPQTKTDLGGLFRTVGFSSSPGLIRILGIIPGSGSVVFIGALVWMLMASVIAVRQALAYSSTLRAVEICAMGWMIQLSALMLFSSIGD